MPTATNTRKWTRLDKTDYSVHLTKEYSPNVWIRVYMIDARYRFVIGGRVGTKYHGFTVRSQDIKRAVFRRGWKNLGNAKERALDALYWYYQWFEDLHHEYTTQIQTVGNELRAVFSLDAWTEEAARTRSKDQGLAYWGKMIDGKIYRAEVGPYSDEEEDRKPKDATAVVWYPLP